MSAALGADLGNVQGASSAISGNLGYARVDNVIGDELGRIAGLDEVVQDVVGHANAIAEALSAINAAIDLNAAAASAESGRANGEPIDAAALGAAVDQLGEAVAVGPVIDKIKEVLSDPDNVAAIKKATGEAGLTGGVEDARAGLKSVTPHTVDVAQRIRGVIASIKSHEALASSPESKAALEAADTKLTAILGTLGGDIQDLVNAVDEAIGRIFN